jgi:hypothetical protein
VNGWKKVSYTAMLMRQDTHGETFIVGVVVLVKCSFARQNSKY